MAGKLTQAQADLLRREGRFPDDYSYLGINRDDNKMRFRNLSEGFVVEIFTGNSEEE